MSPSPTVSCSGCSATWTGASLCHCSGCHRLFSGVRLFDAHRSNHGQSGTCLAPEYLDGMTYRNGAWRGPEMPTEAIQRRKGSST